MALRKLDAYRQSYHSGVGGASWRRQRNVAGRMVGIEFEVESSDGDYATLLRALPMHDTDVDGPQPHFEYDGSLSSSSGVEIVFPPYPLDSFREDTNYFVRAMEHLDEHVSDDLSRCGMHMNVNAHGWTSAKTAAFVCLVHWLPRARLEEIGTRTLNGYCNQTRVESIVYYTDSPGNSHSYAAEVKEGRVELRFPGTTTNVREVRRLIAFIESLEDFAELDYNPRIHPQALVENYLEFLLAHSSEEYNAIGTLLSR